MLKTKFAFKQVSRLNRVIDILARNDSDAIEQIAALLFGQTKSADLTLYDYTDGEVVYSTIYNTDRLAMTDSYLKRKNEYPEYLCAKRPEGIFSSDDVQCIEIFSLADIEMPFVLLLEYCYVPSNDGLLLNDKELVKLLFVSAGIKKLSYLKRRALHLDASTMLPEREALLEELQMIQKDTAIYSLGIISVINMPELNREKGLAYGEEVIKAVSDTLQKYKNQGACRLIYRTGQNAFAIPVACDLYMARNLFENLLDRLFTCHSEIKFTCVVTPVIEDVYRTLYICESYSATNEADCVTVVRDAIPSADAEEYMHVEQTLMVQHPREAEKDSVDDTISVTSEEELKNEHASVLPKAMTFDEVCQTDKKSEEEMFFDLFGEEK